MKLRNLLYPPALLVAALWLALLLVGQHRFFQDPGTFWHVRVGFDLLGSPGFFSTDSYSFTFAGERWIPHQWLGEILMSLVYRVGQFDALLAVSTFILAVTFGLLGMRLMKAGLHPSISIVVLAIGLAASAGHFHVRPHLATMAGTALLVVMLVRFDRGEIGLRSMCLLIPVFWLWSQCHGGALGGLATLALAFIGWCLQRRLLGEGPITSVKSAVGLCLIGLSCAAVSLLNPYGTGVPRAWLQIYGMSSLTEIIIEHRPTSLKQWDGWAVLACSAVYVAALYSARGPGMRVTWFLPAVWLILGWMRIRHAPLFAIVTLAVLSDIIPKTRWAENVMGRGGDLFTPENIPDSRHRFRWAIPAVLTVIVVFAQTAGLQVPVIGRGWAHLDAAKWPVELQDDLEAVDRSDVTHPRYFCEMAYGGYLILFHPESRVFLDDRCELYGDRFLTDYVVARDLLQLDAVESSTVFDNWEQRFGMFDLALVETDGGWDRALSKMPRTWSELRRTRTAVLYERLVPVDSR